MASADIEQFGDPDPLVSDRALERLATQGPEVIKELLPLDSSWPNRPWHARARLVRLCKRLGPAIVPHLLELIKVGAWHAKVTSSPCFRAFAGNDRVGGAILGLMDTNDIDVRRLTIEALGYAAYGGSYEIIQTTRYGNSGPVNSYPPPVSKYYMEKFAFYAIQALLRIFAKSGEGSLLDQCQELLADFQEHVREEEFGWDIDGIMRELEPVAADALIRKWLEGSSDKYKNHALTGLSHLRLRRTLPVVARFLGQASTDLAAGIALGDTVHPDAGRLVASAISDGVASSGVTWALSTLYALKIDWPDCSPIIASVVHGDHEVGAQMRYSLALRCDKSVLKELETGLNSQQGWIRSVSAIALVRLLGAEAEPLLSGRENETSSSDEKLLVLAALIHMGRHDLLEQLDLVARQHDFTLLRPIWKREVLAAFIAASPPGDRRPALWAEIANEDLGRVEQDLRTLGVQINGIHEKSKIAAVPAPIEPITRVFVSYSHNDRNWLKTFQVALKPLLRRGTIDLWDDTRLKPGTNWKDSIDLAMKEANVALLLASQNFLNSDFVVQHELKTLLAAAQGRGVEIVWVAIDHALYEETELGALQAANDPQIPLVDLTKAQRQKEVVRICRYVRDLANRRTPST